MSWITILAAAVVALMLVLLWCMLAVSARCGMTAHLPDFAPTVVGDSQ